MKATGSANIEFEIAEMFYSIQGEGTRAGLPCVFVRMQGCNLSCEWCDTGYARRFGEGKRTTLQQIMDFMDQTGCDFIEFTGGEPLLQPTIYHALEYFCDGDKIVAIETNGSVDISKTDPRAIRIMDVKCPDSNMSMHNKMSNLELITRRDEVKFVLQSRNDYLFARDIIRKYDLTNRTNAVLMSAVYKKLNLPDLASWILGDKLQARLQLQLHKYIFGPDTRGV